jgi:hypothetical protein
MGLISWIKNKYNNYKFDKAQQLYQGGNYEEAIEILKDILDLHPEAPEQLLSVYHSQIANGNLQAISCVAELYSSYPTLKQSCLKFSQSLDGDTSYRLVINYRQTLYCKHLLELKPAFVRVATDYILTDYILKSNAAPSALNELTKNPDLLNALSLALFEEVKRLYNERNNLQLCEKVFSLMLPYCTSNEFLSLYSNIRFDISANKAITTSTISELDSLFKDAKREYRLDKVELKKLADKGLKLAQDKYTNHKYSEALLLSQRLLEKYPEACAIYSDSAYEIYRNNPADANLIQDEYLYKSIGANNLITGLERFLKYAHHNDKYVSVVCEHLIAQKHAQIHENEELLIKSWHLTSDTKLIGASLSNRDSRINESFALFILNHTDIFFDKCLNVFVQAIINFSNIEFIVSILESLLSKGKSVESYYETSILKLATGNATKSKARIEVIDRGLSKINPAKFYSTKAQYIDDYLKNNSCDIQFAMLSSESLIGKDDTAEILIAKIYIIEATKSNEVSIKEELFLKALKINTHHNRLFNQAKYNSILPEVRAGLAALATKIYSTNHEHAIEILYKLRDSRLEWYDTYARLRLKTFDEQAPSHENATQLLSIISEGDGTEEAIKELLWNKYAEIEYKIANSSTVEASIQILRNLNRTLTNLCQTSNRDHLIEVCDNKLSKQLFNHAKEYEIIAKFGEAKSLYEEALKFNSEISLEVKTRLYICKLKFSDTISNKDRSAIAALLSSNKSKAWQKDLAYRWCIYLLNSNNFDDVIKYNHLILGNDPQLAQICQDQTIIKQQKCLDELNEKIGKLNNLELSAQEAIEFGQSLSHYVDEVNIIVEIPKQKQNILKEAIRIYAIRKYYEEGNFIQCQKGLKVQETEFMSDPVAMRNNAIMCLRAAEDGQLTDNNYQELLAIWATTIYQQRIFVKSLDYTSWDDPYTFSLSGALGVLDENDDDLPENVNYSCEVQNNIVSIRDVQKSLINRMESALNDHHNYQQFFSAQLEAMDKLSEQNLDEQCVIVAPFMLTISDVYKRNISHALTIEANQHYDNWETILEIGSLYGLDNNDFGKYGNASAALQQAIHAIESKSGIRTAFTRSKIQLISSFEGLKSTLVSVVLTAVNDAITNDIGYAELYNKFAPIVKIVEDDTLSYAFSNYVNQSIVRELNNKSIFLAQGAKILFDIYDFCKCNHHLKRNIDNIVEALVQNYITDGDDNNISVLENLLSNTREFDQIVVKALTGENEEQSTMLCLIFSSNESRFNTLKSRLSPRSRTIQNQFTATANKITEMKLQLELSQIVKAVNEETMDKCDAIEKVYKLYRNNSNNDRVCENLATLIPMCVMEYIINDKYGKRKVIQVLDSLKNNISTTFRHHNSCIGEAYNSIWNQLPSDARSAILYSSYQLNDAGKSLSKGLDYLKALK